jgi:ferredoxin
MGEASTAEVGAMTRTSECLCCPDLPCMTYSADEAEADVVVDVTRDPRREVCAFDAIVVDESTRVPKVIEERCSACGLCVARCPVGAIAWSRDAVANVQIPDGGLTEPTLDLSRHTRAREQALTATERYVPSGAEWERLRERFDSALERASTGQRRLLVRNLLRGLSLAAQLSVRGDTSDRTEITVADGAAVVLAEIGRDVDLLEGVRRVMTAVAIAHARRGVPRSLLTPAVFMLRMPNQRTDGYELVKDLATVLGLEVAILPVAALHLGLMSAQPDSFQLLLGAGRSVDVNPEGLDVGPAVTEALELPEESTGGSTAFRPPK